MNKTSLNLLDDDDGASGIEFALLAPVFIIFFLMAITVFDLFRTYQNIVQANGIVADVVSRQTSIDDKTLNNLYGVFTNIQTTRQSENAIRVSILKRKGAGFEVTWSKLRGSESLFPDQEIEPGRLPDISNGDSIVYVEGAARYLGLTSFFGLGEIPLSSVAFSRPRFASTIVYNGLGF